MTASKNRLRWRAALVMLAAGAIALSANADWTVINLHPEGSATWSVAKSVHEGQQVGLGGVGGFEPGRAILWNGTAASWVGLTPSGAGHSSAGAVYAGQQGGYAHFGGVAHASLWSGSAASWIDLHPAGATFDSQINTVQGGQQAGSAFFGGEPHAGRWSGTAASWVDMHPPGAQRSGVLGGDGVQQVGVAFFGGVQHAGMWSGTAASWVDLHPAVANGWSFAAATADGQQVGAVPVGGIYRASLWTGSAASWVDLSPQGATYSQIGGVHGGLQVGYATLGGVNRACLWNGTADSLVDLHQFVPGGFNDSVAAGIWTDGPNIYVVGHGTNAATGRPNALMWVFEPEADPDTDADGLLDIDEIDIYGTDPNDSDTDDDGLLDGTEVDMAQGTGCPDPLNPDSDGDTLSDGAEVALGTSPCATDTDADGIPDNVDPLPLDPEGTGEYVETALRTLCDFIHARPLSEFDAPNNNAAKGRRNAMCNKVMAAANAVADEDFGSAIDGLSSLLDKLDDQPEPPDWMHPGEARDDIGEAIEAAIAILVFM